MFDKGYCAGYNRTKRIGGQDDLRTAQTALRLYSPRTLYGRQNGGDPSRQAPCHLHRQAECRPGKIPATGRTEDRGTAERSEQSPGRDPHCGQEPWWRLFPPQPVVGSVEGEPGPASGG